MKQKFRASVWHEEGLWIAQCLDVDIASQGPTEDEALENLKEALTLYFESPTATNRPTIRTVEIELGAT